MKSNSEEAILVETDVSIAMRDGAILRADIYKPARAGRFPTLVQRTLYGKGNQDYEDHVEHARRFASAGYVVVVQDVRGRFASEGDFRPGFFSPETDDADDGFDTIEWAARLPYSNGLVGTYGISYDGWTQWVMAHTRPPHLVTMAPGMIAANLLDREMSGVLRLGRVLYWCVVDLSPERRRREGLPAPHTFREAERLWRFVRGKWLWHLPLSDLPDEAIAGMRGPWMEWLRDHESDHFGFQARHSATSVPVLTITGWYDQQIGAIKHFTGMSENGMTSHARRNQRLIIGPWTHSTSLSRQVGAIDFGPDAQLDYVDLCLEWFDLWLKSEVSEISPETWAPVRIFIMGLNSWRNEEEWPLARTEYTAFYFHSAGSANTPLGDGSLSMSAPADDEPPDHYVYDPNDPVMTFYSEDAQHEPWDLSSLDDRKDVLVYQTQQLMEPLEVTGPVSVILYASSSAPDTDWIAKLIDVWPDGFSQELSYGIMRARFRAPRDSQMPLVPDRIYEFVIVLNPTSNLFKVGHRIRVSITSSDFPNFDRNHNVGNRDYFDSEIVSASQTIFHNMQHRSHIMLPLITIRK